MNDHDLLFKGYRPRPKRLIKAEIISFIGRILSPRTRKTKNKYLQIGCGNSLPNNFDNIDFFPTKVRDIKSVKHICHDLRYPLPYEDNTFEGGFTEHTLEHFYYDESINLLREIKRVLKPNSILRCAIPDLKKYVNFYNGNISNSFFEKFDYKAQAIWCLTQNYTHRSVWDYELLSNKMKEIGLKDIIEKQFYEGQNPDLLLDRESRKLETLYVECKI